MRDLLKTLRWRIAERLDWRQDLCWTNLCCWAAYDEPWRDLTDLWGGNRTFDVTASCFDGPGETCYCGKLEKPCETRRA